MGRAFGIEVGPHRQYDHAPSVERAGSVEQIIQKALAFVVIPAKREDLFELVDDEDRASQGFLLRLKMQRGQFQPNGVVQRPFIFSQILLEIGQLAWPQIFPVKLRQPQSQLSQGTRPRFEDLNGPPGAAGKGVASQQRNQPCPHQR